MQAGRGPDCLPPPVPQSHQTEGAEGKKGHGIGQRGCRKHGVQNLKNQQLSSFFISSPSNKDHGRRQDTGSAKRETSPLPSPHGERPPGPEMDVHRSSHIQSVLGWDSRQPRGRRGRVCTDESIEGSATGFWSSRASAVTPMWGDPGSRAHRSGSLTKSPHPDQCLEGNLTLQLPP